MLSYINTGQYKAMFIRYNQFNNYWHDTHSNNRNNHISDQFENEEMTILIQQIDNNSEKQTFVLNINAANQTFNSDGQDLGLFFGEDPFLHEWLYHYANRSLISPNEPIKRTTIKNNKRPADHGSYFFYNSQYHFIRNDLCMSHN